MPDTNSPPNPLHPQAKALGKNKFANPPKKEGATVSAQPATSNTPTVAVASAPKKFTKAGEAESAIARAITATAKDESERDAAVYYAARAAELAQAAPKPPSLPGKDLKRFEITVSINGSDEPPFVVDVPLTGNGPADQAAARALAKKKFPGRAMTVISSRIFTRTENCLLEIAPGSTLSSLFGATGGVTEDLIEVGKAFYDGSRGTLFLRNMRSHVGLTFRPSTGGLVVFSNRIVSNRLASELPIIVAEILGNNAREIEIYLKP